MARRRRLRLRRARCLFTMREFIPCPHARTRNYSAIHLLGECFAALYNVGLTCVFAIATNSPSLRAPDRRIETCANNSMFGRIATKLPIYSILSVDNHSRPPAGTAAPRKHVRGDNNNGSARTHARTRCEVICCCCECVFVRRVRQ